MRIAVAVVLSAAVVIPVAPAADSWYGFATPSRNIVCNGSSTGLACVVFSASKTCQRTWSMKATGRARVRCKYANIGTEVPVLRYGQSLARFGMRCLSQRRGLRCANRDAHGFFLSRKSQRTF